MFDVTLFNPSSSKKLEISENLDFDFIPEEIVADILTRLPVKSLMRFRCVSKSWLSLISTPRFIKRHLLCYSPSSPRILLNYDHPNYCTRYCTGYGMKHCSAHSLISEPMTVETIDIDYPTKHSDRCGWVVGSCNGLLCVSVGRGDLLLWNPCTRKHKKLVPPNVEMNWKAQYNDFGYNEIEDDYKVLRLYVKTGKLEIYTYSLRANSWKFRVYMNSGITEHGSQKYFAGKIHISIRPPGYNSETDDPMLFDIVSIDLEHEMYEMMIEQPDYGESVWDLYLAELGGCFCVVCTKEFHADLWIMKEYGVKNSWSKMLTVSIPNGFCEEEYVNPLILLPSGDILLTYRARFEVYNLKDNTMRVLETSNTDNYFLEAHAFVESLVSPTEHERMRRQEDQNDASTQ